MSFEMSDEPLDHVLRSGPPWRSDDGLTECGLPADGKPVIDRQELVARIKKLGKTRTAMFTCLTCWRTVGRYGAPKSWADDPVSVIARDAKRVEFRDGEAVVFRNELLAIAELVRRHQVEFAEILAGINGTVRLADRRGRRRAQ